MGVEVVSEESIVDETFRATFVLVIAVCLSDANAIPFPGEDVMEARTIKTC